MERDERICPGFPGDMIVRMAPTPRESVATARNGAEEDAVEQALKTAGIEYVVTVEATRKSDGAVCFLSMVYEVAAPDAARARAVLEVRGLGGNVLHPGR